MIFNRITFFFFSLFLINQSMAQRIVTGRVVDFYTKEPVEHVAITIFKSGTTTLTNHNGYFQLTLNQNDSLIITHKDYKSGVLTVPDDNVFIVYIEPFDENPVYLEGIANLYTYLRKSLIFPAAARMKRIEGVLFIELIIDENGKVADCRNLNELGGNCEKTALEVFRSIPGTWSGANEAQSLIFPLVYLLSGRTESLDMPDIQLPVGKMMDRIIIQAFTN